MQTGKKYVDAAGSKTEQCCIACLDMCCLEQDVAGPRLDVDVDDEPIIVQVKALGGYFLGNLKRCSIIL